MWQKMGDKLEEWADDFPLRNELALFGAGVGAGAGLMGFIWLLWG